MEEIRIDNSVLRDEADKFLEAIAAYRETAIEDAPSSLSKEFGNRAQNVEALIDTVANILQPLDGATIVEVLSAQNYSILANVRSKKGYFDHDPQKRRHFLKLVDKIYVHGPKKAFEGERVEKDAAKRILREFVEATILYFVMVRKKNQGLEYDPTLVRQVVHKAHELISDNPDCVVAFPADRWRGPKLA